MGVARFFTYRKLRKMSLAVLPCLHTLRAPIGKKFPVGVARFFTYGKLRKMSLAVLPCLHTLRAPIGEKVPAGVARLVTEFSRQAVVVINPIRNGINGKFRCIFTDDHFLDACIEHKTLAHHAGAGASHNGIGFGISACHI